MSRRRRSEEISLKVSSDYHVTTKCSRSLHLLVPDEASDLPEGAVPEHPDGRKDLLLGRLRFLAGVMAIDVSAFSVMANHLHLILRTRIEEALDWSPEEVVDRWRILHPHRDRRQKPRETTAADRAADLANRFFVKECRRKLLDVSQLMKELKQFVAQEVNKLEGVPGALWAGRFKAERIGDPAALVEVMVYIDLNPFRAGLCPTPEAGRHTSLSARLGWLHAEREAGAKAAAGSAEGWLLPLDAAVEQRRADEPLAEGRSGGERVVSAGLTLPLYLKILDGVSRRWKRGKQQMDASAASLLDRLGVDAEELTQRVLARCGPSGFAAPG